jgi:gentisate 1,2-dioxygenase
MDIVRERLGSRQGPASTLDELYEDAQRLSLAVGWVPRKAPIMGSKERSGFKPQYWNYGEVHTALEAAGGLIDVELAERRNLILRNAIPDNEWATSRTLVCAYQMILPGETAPSHCHTSNALRVIIDGRGSYSVVDGVKMPMESGDVVLTPSGHWHGHGHEGDEPAYWLDCLDVPLTYLLEPMYFTPHPQKYEPIEETVSESPYRFSRELIARGLDAAHPDPEMLNGRRLLLPTPSMPAVGLHAERLEGGQVYREHRKTSNRIFSVMEGRGESSIGESKFSWSRGDTFLAPSSYWMQHRASSDALLLEMSDEPLMRFTNYFKIEVR